MFSTCRSGPGQPTFARCVEAIKKWWISWAGNPNAVQCDRGLHHGGILAQYMSAHGIQVYHAPLETPEAMGRVERHGGVLKGMARKVIAQTKARGEVEIESVLDESCLSKNSPLRHGGYSPSQWVLGKGPREAPSLVSEDRYPNEQQLALADMLVLQSLKLSVLLQDALHVIQQTICLSRYMITLSVQGKVRLQAMTKHKLALLCAVESSSLHLWLIGEQVEHQRKLKDLPGNLDCRRESPTVQS